MALAITTCSDLITLALKNAGIIGVGQTAGAEDMNDACQMLNAMLGQWQRRRYLVYHLVEQSIPCTGAQSYSVGPGGDFSMSARPSIINYAFARQVINANPNQIDYPLAILPARETYATIAMKSLQSFPQWCWFDAAYPLGQLFVYPVITSQFSIFIGYPEILQTVSSLTDTINLPPEYAQALLYNLAIMLAGAYQMTPNPVVVGLAKAALETMRTANAQIPQMRLPRILNGSARYNIFSDRAGPGQLLMPLVPLLGGNYQGRSTQAASRLLCVNLYPERNASETFQPIPDSQSLTPVTYYCTPGLNSVGVSPNIEAVRNTYRATNGALYVVVGPTVYSVTNTFAWTMLGTVADNTTPLVFTDNGLVVVAVDGSTTGYAIDMTTNAFGVITDPSFLGALSDGQQDGFFIFNLPGTNKFYISLENVTFAMLTGVTGRILTGSIAAPGTGYVNGSYTNVPLTGGTGTGATADITVAGTAVSILTLVNPGTGYAANDTLSASNTNLGGSGSGFAYAVDQVATAFDPLDIASKSSTPDPIVAVAPIHGVLWLIGQLSSEVWAPSGAADFYFQRIPGAVINHGCAAPYSLAQQDVNLFWLSQDAQGHGIIVKAQDTSILRISTNAIEQDIQTYANISDAIGFCHQVEGHSFYVLNFPSADVTWVYDLSTGQWHRRVSIDGNGVQHRWRANCFAFAFGMNLVGDYQNGKLYALDSTFFTDDGTAIPRIVTFPHMANGGQRCLYSQFQAKMMVGQIANTPVDQAPQAALRFSDDAGQTFSNAVMQSLGASGQYLTSPQWQRLGMARDRIFELSWSCDADVALAGAWINFKVAAT